MILPKGLRVSVKLRQSVASTNKTSVPVIHLSPEPSVHKMGPREWCETKRTSRQRNSHEQFAAATMSVLSKTPRYLTMGS